MTSGNVVFGREALRGMFRLQAAMNTAAGSMRRVDEVRASGGVRSLAALAVAVASMFMAAPSMAVRQQSAVASGDAAPGAIASSAPPVAASSSDGSATAPLLVGVPIGLDQATGRLGVDRDQLRAALAAMMQSREDESPIVALVPRGDYGQFRAGRLDAGARERLLAAWGDPAIGAEHPVPFADRYADALAAALGSAIDEVRAIAPDARVTVVNLPIDDPRDRANVAEINDRLRPLTDRFDLFMSGRARLGSFAGQAGESDRLLDLPEMARAAAGRPVLLRSLAGWTAVPTSAISEAPHGASDRGLVENAGSEGGSARDGDSSPLAVAGEDSVRHADLQSDGITSGLESRGSLQGTDLAAFQSDGSAASEAISTPFEAGFGSDGVAGRDAGSVDPGRPQSEAGSATGVPSNEASDADLAARGGAGRSPNSVPASVIPIGSHGGGDGRDPATRVGRVVADPPPTGLGSSESLRQDGDAAGAVRAGGSPSTDGSALQSGRGGSGGSSGTSGGSAASGGSSRGVASGSPARGGASAASGGRSGTQAGSGSSSGGSPGSSIVTIPLPSTPPASGVGGASGPASPPSTPPSQPAAPPPPPNTWNPSSGVNSTTPITGGSGGSAGASAGPSGGGSTSSSSPFGFALVGGGARTSMAWWACDPFRDTTGRLWIGVNAAAAGGIDFVRFEVEGLGATTVSTPSFHPDRRINAYWISLMPDQVAGSAAIVTARVQPNGVSAALLSDPVSVNKSGNSFAVLAMSNGWTVLTPSADSRIVYIAANGNDAAAAQVKGRGYYLPSDPEIGADPTQPVGVVVAYRNPAEAAKRLRANSPEWVLFRRGQTFSHAELVVPAESVWHNNISSNIGILFTWAWVPQQNRFGYENGYMSGRSPSERFVFSAWGPPSEPRPKFTDSLSIATPGSWGRFQNTVVASLDIDNFLGFGLARFDQGNTSSNILIEDCRMRQLGHSGGPITVRRSVITGNFSPTSHNQGVFVRAEGGDKEILTFEECVFDHNGFKDNPFDPSTWSSAAVSSGVVGAVPAGTGVQPTRTFYDRNIYCSTGDGVNHMRFVLRGSIVSRGGGGGTVQMRQGGISERNVYLWNEDVGTMNSGPGGVFSRNLVLHDDHMLPPGGWGMGLKVFNSETWNNEGKGWSLDPDPHYIVDDSIFAHFHRGSNGGGMLDVYNTSTRHHANGANYGTLLNGRVTVTNNVLHRSLAEGMRLVTFGTWDAVTIGGNQIGVGSGAVVSTRRSNQDLTPPSVHLTSVADKGSVPYSIGDSVSGGNLYWSQSSIPFANRTFAQWQALRSGLDSQSQFFSDFAAFKTAAGWTAPERDIVSYMQSIDPAFVPNEDVTTDDGVPADKRRPDAQLVRQVMQSTGMSDAHARLTARRYHAFITFIERAKANRKGAWDPAYTADALNNHIRAGFGKN